MPTYAYECTGCGHAFEAFQKMSDDPLTQCGSCGGALKKRMFPVGIVFKGSGFYVNDYARKGQESASEPAAKASETAPAAATGEKSGSTPAGGADSPSKPAEAPAAPAKPAAKEPAAK